MEGPLGLKHAGWNRRAEAGSQGAGAQPGAGYLGWGGGRTRSRRVL